ncbi:MAG: right-handed parallel beta-helix repeat-containing protein [Nanoarchaeota archaeon]|nr:right-handed parallel beta-helix repeat-containing protein [Nanoarchaeota archaeon]
MKFNKIGINESRKWNDYKGYEKFCRSGLNEARDDYSESVFKRNRNKMIVSLFTVILLVTGALFMISMNEGFTGNAIFLDKDSFAENEIISGNFEIPMSETDLLPSDSRVRLSVDGNKLYEIPLSDLISMQWIDGDLIYNGNDLGYGQGFSSNSVINVDLSKFDLSLPAGDHNLKIELVYTPEVLSIQEVQSSEIVLVSSETSLIVSIPEPIVPKETPAETPQESTVIGSLSIEDEPLGIQEVRNVTGCGDTFSANSVYTLNQSLNSNGTCFNILANNITLDCQGHTITGNQSSDTSGINLAAANITVRNCMILNYTYGIYLSGSSNNNLTNNTANSNSQGIYLSSSSNNTLIGNTANNNSGFSSSSGIFVSSGSNNNTIADNIVTLNTKGIFFSSASNYNTIINNTANNNTEHGIYLSSSSDDNTLTNNIAINNGDTSIWISSSSNITIMNNTLSSGYGLVLDYSSNNTVTNNNASNNRYSGIYLAPGSSNNILASNIAGNNSQHGIKLDSDSNNNTLTNNTANNNANYGIYLFGSNNNTIAGNNASSNSYGIYLSGSNNTLTNNIAINNSAIGIFLISSSNNKLSNNIASLNYYNLYFSSSANGNTITNNDLVSSKQWGLYFGADSSNNSLFGTTISEQQRWSGYKEYIFTGGTSTGNNMTNTTFIENTTKVNYIQTITLEVDTNVNELNNFNLSYNKVFVNSTDIISFNKSAEITFYDLTFDNPQIMVMWDDITPEVCPPGVCQNVSYNSTTGTFVFNVSHFTTYAAQESPAPPVTEQNISECQTLNQENMTYYLNNSVNSTGTCFNIQANNVTLDCGGFTINYTNPGAEGYGVRSTADFTTIKNCTFLQGNPSTYGAYAIEFNPSSNSLILNNNFTQSNDANTKIRLLSSQNTTILNNVFISGSYGIYGVSSHNNTIKGNNLVVHGTDSGLEFDSCSNNSILSNNISITRSDAHGIRLLSSNNNNISSNTISTINSSAYGIRFQSSSNNLLSSNNVSTTGDSAYGIYLSSSSNNNTLSSNTISTANLSAHGIDVSFSSSNNSFLSNNISTTGDSASGIYLSSSSGNNLTSNKVSTTGNTAFGIYLSSSSNNTLTSNIVNSSLAEDFYSDSSSGNILKNMTFSSSAFPTTASLTYDGTIKIDSADAILSPGFYNVGRYLNITGDVANVLLNISYVNTIGANESNLKMYKYDGSAWVLANTTSDYNGVDTTNKVVYANITSFSIFAPLAEIPFETNLTYCQNLTIPDQLYYLNNSVTTSGTCFNIQANNVTLDCQGFMINYSQSVVGYGINVTGYNDVVIRNCNIIKGNSSTSNAPAIYIKGGLRAVVGNNNISTNGSSTYAINLVSYSNHSILKNNNLSTIGGGGIYLKDGLNNTVINNSIEAIGKSYDGLYLVGPGVEYSGWSSVNNTIEGNNIKDYIYGISIDSTSGSILNGNKINSTYTNSPFGIKVIASYSPSIKNNITNNEIIMTHPSARGITFADSGKSANNTLINNRIMSQGVYISTDKDANNNNITNTTFFSDNASIRFPLTITIPINSNVNNSNFLLSFNKTFLNSSILQFLNTSAEITFKNLTFINPQPIIDIADNGNYVVCSEPKCYEIDYNSTTKTFIFNVSDFTTYSSQETPPYVAFVSPQNITYNSKEILINITNSSDAVNVWWYNGTDNLSYTGPQPYNFSEGWKTVMAYANNSAGITGQDSVTFFIDTVNVTICRELKTANMSYKLQKEINSSGSCLYIKANNVTLDCQGNIINYSQMTSSGGMGINISDYNYATIKNCKLVQDNSTVSSASSYAIYIKSASNSTILNNTITTRRSIGIYNDLILNSSFAENKITTYGNDDDAIFFGNSQKNIILNNIINTNGNTRGIYFYSSPFNNFINNTIIANNAGINTYSIYLLSSSNNTLTNNLVRSLNIDFYSSGSSDNTITNMTFNSSDSPAMASFTYNGNIQVGSANALDSQGFYNVSKYLNITNMTPAWVLLNISYTNETIGANENNLKMYKHNGTDWILANTTSLINGVDNISKVVYANITSFSVFAPLAEMDTTAPVIHLVSPENNTIANQAIQTFSCNISNTEIANLTLFIWNSTGSQNYTNTTLLTGEFNETNWTYELPEDGNWKWNCKGYDVSGNGNWSVEGNYTLRLDRIAPMISVISPKNITYNTNTIWFNATANEPVGSWIVNYNGTNVTLPNINSSLTVEDGLNYNLLLYANDTAGNWGLNDSIWFSVDNANVTSCKNLTTENAVYTLSINMNSSGTCFNILENNITLDCQGYNITGKSPPGPLGPPCINNGIVLSGRNNVTIKNCTINKYDCGLYLNSSNYTALSNNLMNMNGIGIALLNASNNNLANNILSRSGMDFYSAEATRNKVQI